MRSRLPSARPVALFALLLTILVPGCEGDGIERPSALVREVVILSPLDGSRLLGTVEVTVDVSGRREAERVELLVDGEAEATDSEPPWAFDWDTGTLAEGSSHTLRAVAYDGVGKLRRSSIITVTLGERAFDGAYGIFTINADGTDLRPLLMLQFLAASVHLSPDGASLTFTGYRQDLDGDGLIDPLADAASAEIYLADADGSGLRRLTDNLFVEEDLQWSADGRGLLFSTDRSNPGSRDIFRRELVGSRVRNWTATPGLREKFPAEGGNYIYYSRRAADGGDEGADVWRVNVLSQAQTQVTGSGIAGDPPGWIGLGDVTPDLSPDATELVFSRSRGASALSPLGDIDVIILTLESGAEVDLSRNEASDIFPHYSPDGSLILVTVWDEGLPDGAGLALIDPLTGERTDVGPLPEGLLPLDADWFPGAAPEIDSDPDIIFAAKSVTR